jgi:hypothetical protein
MLYHSASHVSRRIMSMESGLGGGACPGWIGNRTYGQNIPIETKGAVDVLVLCSMEKENDSLGGQVARLNTRYCGSSLPVL